MERRTAVRGRFRQEIGPFPGTQISLESESLGGGRGGVESEQDSIAVAIVLDRSRGIS